MAQLPGTGTADQILRMLAAMAQSSAYSAELATVTANYSTPGVLAYSITDANGTTTSIDLAETKASDPQLSFIKDTTYGQVLITDGIKIVPPFPRMVLIGQRPRLQARVSGGNAILDQGHAYLYSMPIDAVSIVSTSDPQIAERRALMMADAFSRLIARNEHLGGLVQLIQAEGDAAPASRPWGDSTIGAALVRYQVQVMRSVP